MSRRAKAAPPPAPAPRLGARGTWSVAWPGLLLATALLLPFLHKAHAIDDVTFLLQAQHALADPWHPTAFEMVADGYRIRLSSKLATGPLMAWLLVPCVGLGGAEWVAHLLQWLLVCVTIVCTARIGFRLGLARSAARLSALLVASTPAVIGMATTSMSDIPAMAFAALGVERFLAWADERRVPQGVLAALAFALAGLARSHALAMPLVAALALIPRANESGPRLAIAGLPLTASLLLAFAVLRLTADPVAASGTVLDAIRGYGFTRASLGNLAGFGVHWLTAIPLALPWLVARARHVARDPVAWGVLALAFVFLRWGASPPMSTPLAAATALAFVALADVLRDAARRRDRTQLLLGAWLLPALAALFYVHLPCKFLLVSAPAAALLTARLIDRADARLPVGVAGLVVAAGAALGVAIVLADAEFAGIGRRVARDVIAPRVKAGERVTYYGAWGAQWYAMQAGASVDAMTDPRPAAGTIMVVDPGTPGSMPRGHEGLEPLGEVNVTSRFGRAMSLEDHIGFYSNRYGYLPWTWKNAPIERITVWRVGGLPSPPPPTRTP